MNSRTHKIYEDLLDDVSVLSTSDVDTSDSSPEWTDTDYYDLLIMIPYNLNTQHSYQETISKCEDVGFILSTVKHIDDYSQVFAFCSNTEKTMPDPLEYPYVRSLMHRPDVYRSLSSIHSPISDKCSNSL